MSSEYRSGQAVQVLLQQKDGTDDWENAVIDEIYDDCIHVKYIDPTPNHDESLDFIKTADIASKLRLVPEQRQNENIKDIETSDFKKGDTVQYKIEGENDTDLWVPATVIYVGELCKFIRISYTAANGEIKSGLMLNECEYKDQIRINSMECKDNNQDQGDKQSQVKTDDVDPDIKMKDKYLPQLEPEVNSKEEKKEGDGYWIVNKCNAALNKCVDAKNYVFGSKDNEANGDDDKSNKPRKRKKVWNEKAILEWSHQDVTSWVKSMKSYEKYADNFPKHMDGKELLDTTIDDLTLIIPKKMWRRKFIQQIESAKQKYAKSKTSNNKDGDGNDADDDYKEIASSQAINEVNGVVGLKNLGNTCYMNTCIQILSQSPYITRYLKKRAKMNNKAKHGQYPMLTAWTNLCNIIYNQCKSERWQYRITSPGKIRDALKAMDAEFGSGAQDDSARALGYILQALDQEIDQEIKQQGTRKEDIVYKDDISIYHGRKLNEAEKTDVINELIQDHNPCNSIIRKTFDGIEHIICQCLECDHIFQQFTTFRIIDLAVVSHEITLKNINIICNNKYYHIPEVCVLDYCSIDLLQYHAIQHISNKQQAKITNYDANIINISSNGTVRGLHTQKISELQNMSGGIFVLINTNQPSTNESGRILQIDLALNRNSDKFERKILSAKYDKYDPNEMYKLVQSEIQSRMNSDDNDDDEKYDFYINYNGNILSTKELKLAVFRPNNMHNIEGVNVLFILKINQRLKPYCYDISDLDLKMVWESKFDFPKLSELNALIKFKSMKNERKEKMSKRTGYKTIQDRVESELYAIDQSIQVFTAKQNILKITNDFVNLCDKFAFSASTYRQLTNLSDCLTEYEKPKIFDQSAYAYPCPHCRSGSNSQWIKVQKQIVYSPSIFLFHLDRYGKNMAALNTVSSSSYQKGQKLLVNWGSKSYEAFIVDINGKGMRVQYVYDNEIEEIPKWKYSKKLPSYSGGNKYNNYYSSNKFDHGINYDEALCLKNLSNHVYDLYGVSKHSGTTDGGHYTATIKCLTNGQWYNISDSSVKSNYNSPTSHSKSATILAYARKQDSPK